MPKSTKWPHESAGDEGSFSPHRLAQDDDEQGDATPSESGKTSKKCRSVLVVIGEHVLLLVVLKGNSDDPCGLLLQLGRWWHWHCWPLEVSAGLVAAAFVVEWWCKKRRLAFDLVVKDMDCFHMMAGMVKIIWLASLQFYRKVYVVGEESLSGKATFRWSFFTLWTRTRSNQLGFFSIHTCFGIQPIIALYAEWVHSRRGGHHVHAIANVTRTWLLALVILIATASLLYIFLCLTKTIQKPTAMGR